MNDSGHFRNPLAEILNERKQLWRQWANCKGIDPDLMFPGRGESETVKAAKAVCEGCVVREDCLEYALAKPERFGVWGGMSERERRRIRTQRLREQKAAS